MDEIDIRHGTYAGVAGIALKHLGLLRYLMPDLNLPCPAYGGTIRVILEVSKLTLIIKEAESKY